MIIILFASANCKFRIENICLQAILIIIIMRKRTIGILLITFHPKNSSRIVLEYCVLNMKKGKRKRFFFYQRSQFISAWTSANAHTSAHQVFEGRKRNDWRKKHRIIKYMSWTKEMNKRALNIWIVQLS